jgi:hypothetical protein
LAVASGEAKPARQSASLPPLATGQRRDAGKHRISDRVLEWQEDRADRTGGAGFGVESERGSGDAVALGAEQTGDGERAAALGKGVTDDHQWRIRKRSRPGEAVQPGEQGRLNRKERRDRMEGLLGGRVPHESLIWPGRTNNGDKMNKTLMFLGCALLMGGTMVRAAGPTVESLPPSVIKTVPEGGEVNVDATATKEIKVTFSKEMAGDSYSCVQVSSETFPLIVGKPRFLPDRRTCVLTVTLQPEHTYVIWWNSEKYRNFKDTTGAPAVPYLLVFQTK